MVEGLAFKLGDVCVIHELVSKMRMDNIYYSA